jgi:MSHA biogenesis protein MshL
VALSGSRAQTEKQTEGKSVHRRLIVATVVAAIPLTLTAAQESGPLRPLGVVHIEGSGAAAGARPAAAAQVPGQAPVQTPLPPVAVTQLDDRQTNPALDEPITLEFGDMPVPVTEILRILGSQTSLNIIADPAITHTFLGDLKNVTVRQALDIITDQAGLDYTVQGNLVRVIPRELETRVFPIDYVITQRGGNRSMSATSGASGGSGSGTTGGTGVTTGGGGAGGAATSGGTGGGGASASVGGNDAPDFFGGLLEGVRALTSTDGRINLDRTAGLLQVTDRPRNLDRVEAYIEQVMLRVTRQVQIEARVIEVELNEKFEAGINWNKVFSSLTNAVSVGQSVIPASTGTFTLSGNFGDNFTALFSAFAEQGKANVLASPRVMTINNQPALINAGDQEVFFTTTTQRDPQGIITQSTVTPQTLSVGVALSVTPQISADGRIMLSMNPSITAKTRDATSRLGDVVPVLTQRATDTIVIVSDGETIVIAGLMQDKTSTTNTKVPLLGDLPLVGGFFKSHNKTRSKSDLVIMLTPTITGPRQVADHTAREIRRMDAAQHATKP